MVITVLNFSQRLIEKSYLLYKNQSENTGNLCKYKKKEYLYQKSVNQH